MYFDSNIAPFSSTLICVRGIICDEDFAIFLVLSGFAYLSKFWSDSCFLGRFQSLRRKTNCFETFGAGNFLFRWVISFETMQRLHLILSVAQIFCLHLRG